MNLFAKEKQIHRHREQTFGYQRGTGRIKRKEKKRKRGHLIPSELMSHEENLDGRCVGSFFREPQGETVGARPIPFLCI